MKITFLGTAAAEGIPALYCNCPVCQTARHLKGKNIRTRSQILINDDLLIDYPPDTYMHVLNYGLNLDLVDNILITHSHEDHLYPQDLIVRSNYYSPIRNEKTLNIHGNKGVIDKILTAQENKGETDEFLTTSSLVTLEKYTEAKIGEYTVYPLLADHKKNEDSFIYIIRDKQGKTLLYAHDTGYFPEETWNFIKSFKFDYVSLDCTCVFIECSSGHMGIECCAKIKAKMEELNLTKDNTKFIIHHFSHNGKFLDHDEMVLKAQQLGMDVSYDNKIVNI